MLSMTRLRVFSGKLLLTFGPYGSQPPVILDTTAAVRQFLLRNSLLKCKSRHISQARARCRGLSSKILSQVELNEVNKVRSLFSLPSVKPAVCQISRRYIQSSPGGLFKIIDGAIDTKSPTFQKNRETTLLAIQKFASILKVAISGGDAKAIERHTRKNKKLLVSERLKLLFDNVDDVLEVMPLAGMGMKYGDIPRAGVLAAIGKIHGVHCMIIANDATIKAGTIYPISLKKQLRCIEIAQENHLPCIFVVDSGGAFLPLQAEIFLPGGRTFYNEAIMNSLDIPQLAIVCGSCTAGAAYVPTMAQEAIIVEKIGTIFLAGPPLVHAALGEVVTPDELGGARLHSTVSGCTDYYAKTEEEAFEMGRSSVAAFNIAPVYKQKTYKEPVFDAEEILGIIPSSAIHTMDMRKVIARIVDESRMHEFKSTYGTSIVTGFCHISGYLVGILANNGVLSSDASLKGSHFVQLCSQRAIPLVFLQNITPDKPFTASIERAIYDGEKIRAHAKLMSSIACANVPIVTVVVGNSFGIENYVMAGRSFSPRFLFLWPTARVCISDPDSVVEDVLQGTNAAEKEGMMKLLHNQSNALYSSSQGWDDGILLPQDTRKVLSKSLEIIHQMPDWTRHGGSQQKAVMRM